MAVTRFSSDGYKVEPAEIFELHIRTVYRLGVTNIEVRNSVNHPAPEPLRVTGRMTKGEVLAYLATLERLEK